MEVPAYQEAVYHYFSGIAISLGDRAFSKNARKNTQARLEEKLKQADALVYLCKAQQEENREAREGKPEYRQAMRRASEYFTDQGMFFGLSPGAKKAAGIAERLLRYKSHERINNRTTTGTLKVAFGLEFLADACVGLSQMFTGKGNALIALGETLYQAPALALGLMTGKGFLYINDILKRPKEERDIDRTARELVEDGRLLQLVREYMEKSEETVQQSPNEPPPESRIEQLVKLGSGLLSQAGKIKKSIQEKREAREKRKAAENEARKEAIRNRYKNY